MAGPPNIVTILQGDTLQLVSSYLSIRDLSHIRLASKQIKNNVPSSHEVFRTYGQCTFSEYMLRFNTEIDVLRYVGGLLGKYVLGRGSHQLQFCIPHTTERLIMRVGITSVRRAADIDELCTRCGRRWFYMCRNTFKFRSCGVMGIFACLHISRIGINVESPYGMSSTVTNRHSMKYEREEGEDYVFSVGYSASEGAGFTFKLECEDLNCRTQEGHRSSFEKMNRVTWFVDFALTEPEFAANAVVGMRLMG